MELLRLLAMFLVLVVHADFFALGVPDRAELLGDPIAVGMRLLVEALSIGCVDIFVLISGWFGIRPAAWKFRSLLFQTLFYSVGIYLLCLVCGRTTLTAWGLAQSLLLTQDYWFIKAYIGLYLLAPVLNAFVERTDRRGLGRTLVGFFVLQTVMGWLSLGMRDFLEGYSVLSFIGLYLLAAYVRRYGLHVRGRACSGRYLYAAAALVNASVAFGALYVGADGIVERIYYYANPLVVVGALGLVLRFARLRFRSAAVNGLAASCLAVYLVHQHPCLMPGFKAAVRAVYEATRGVGCLAALLGLLALIFGACVLIDRVRIAVWRRLART